MVDIPRRHVLSHLAERCVQRSASSVHRIPKIFLREWKPFLNKNVFNAHTDLYANKGLGSVMISLPFFFWHGVLNPDKHNLG